MPRIRTIKPEYWDDEKIAQLSRDARLVYIALWNFSDDFGVVKGNVLWLKSKVFPYDNIQIKQFEGWLEELQRPGFIVLFQVKTENYYYLPNFCRHQVINKPSLHARNPEYPFEKEQSHTETTEQKPEDYGSTTVALPTGKGIGKGYLYTIGAHGFDSIEQMLIDRFAILYDQLRMKHGHDRFSLMLAEFSEKELEHEWKNEEDFRSHFSNYVTACARNGFNKPKQQPKPHEQTTKSTYSISKRTK